MYKKIAFLIPKPKIVNKIKVSDNPKNQCVKTRYFSYTRHCATFDKKWTRIENN
jgi:hypothetical protein